MKKEFIPYEQALALKELGFDEPCFGYWNIDPSLSKPYLNPRCEPFKHEWCLLAPTFSQAFRWFREKYKIGYNITWNKFYENTPYQWEVRKYWENEPTIPYGYAGMSKTYEESELACLKKLIEMVRILS